MAHEDFCPACGKTVSYWERDSKLFCSGCGMTQEGARAFVNSETAGHATPDVHSQHPSATPGPKVPHQVPSRPSSVADRATKLVGFLSMAVILGIAILFSLNWAGRTLATQYAVGSVAPDDLTSELAALVEPRQQPDSAAAHEQKLREFYAVNPGLKWLEHPPTVRLLHDDLGNLKRVNEPFDWWQRNLEYGNTESRVALTVVLVVAALFLLLPPALCLRAMRKWRPRSRASYACRFSLWGVMIVGWPTVPVFMRIADGFTNSQGEQLLRALAIGAGWSVLLAFLSFGLGSWLGGRRFPVGVPTERPHLPAP